MVPGSECDLLARTKQLHPFALHNHDLPKSIGFVESNRRHVLSGFVEHFGAIAHHGPVPFFIILPFPHILDGVDTAGRYCKREDAGTTGF
jgi:hypothetical protein